MTEQQDDQAVRDEVHCVQLIAAARKAGLEPIRFSYLHAFAYLAEALSSVWGVEASTTEVLKRDGLPFFPRLQRALDTLVWRGVVKIDNFSYVQDHLQRWALEATCRLEEGRSHELLRRLDLFEDERERSDLYLEIGLGLAQSDDVIDLFRYDASYSDPSVSVNRLIEFSPGASENLTAKVADRFSELVDPGHALASGERVGLYIAHLRRTASSHG
ncbi:hypothetical protein [Clavibacter sp. CFBP 8614]|uniref:hypothetical protein n=1 Tax=unclassified Clavibacter TaxID=2626594 RepID=UPI0040426077